jgi:hypothetical protein
LKLAFFLTQHNYLKVPPVMLCQQFIPSNCWVVFHGVNVSVCLTMYSLNDMCVVSSLGWL